MADNFNTRQTFIAQPSIVQPNVTWPSGLAPWDLQPIGSETGISSNQTSLIRRAIAEKIFDAVPKKYAMLRLLFDRPVKYYPSDVFTYMERQFGRVALKISSDTQYSSQPYTSYHQITLSTGGAKNVQINDIVVLPDNKKAVVISVNTTTDTIVVKRPDTTGTFYDLQSTAYSANSYISILAPVTADGQNFFAHYDRMNKVERYNYIMTLQRNKRWSRKEIQKFQNLGTTDYFDLDKKEQLELVLTDMFVNLWNGDRSEVTLVIPGVSYTTDFSNAYKALTTGGIFFQMVNAGSASASGVTKATLQETFEALAFATDYKAEGGVRFIFAQNALLYELSKAFKETGLRYAPNDSIANLNLMEYRIGDMRFVPVACELFKDVSCFPTTWQDRIFVLDLDTIQPVCMTGYQPIETGQTLSKQQGTTFDYIEWWVQGMIGVQMNNPLSSFYIDTTGIITEGKGGVQNP